MNSINFSCQGESHIATGKVCQDYSYSHVYEDGSAIAIVCDGHGGKRYFRSNIGAKIAAEVTERKVRTFATEVGLSLLQGTPFSQVFAISTQIDNQDFAKQSEIERALRRLAGSIIYEWDTEVKAHAAQNPILDKEETDLEERWITEFNNGHNLEKVYGCTLIAYFYTQDFWFAFQIGDGKCFSLNTDGQWSEPIPWDDLCFLNKTTSICDSSAIDEFRFCYEGNGNYPIAMILGSDGIDDSFGASENQANFYVQILKSIVTTGETATKEEIEKTLPQLSKIGSQDDMSLAMVYDNDKVCELYHKLIEWQISNVKRLISEEDAKIQKANKIQESLENVAHPTRQNQIDLQYANADEKRAVDSRNKLLGRLNALLKELNGDNQSGETIDNTEAETTTFVQPQIEEIVQGRNDVQEVAESLDEEPSVESLNTETADISETAEEENKE